MQKYSKTLLSHLPEQTTQILIELCTGTLAGSANTPTTTTSDANRTGAASPTPSAKNSRAALSILPFASSTTVDTASDEGSERVAGAMSSPAALGVSSNKKEAQQRKSGGGGLTYTLPSARTFMPAFVDRPDCLVLLLERVYEKRWGSLSPEKPSSNSDAASVRSYSTSTREDKNAQSTSLPPQEQEERKAIWNTLLELYLMDEQQQSGSSNGRHLTERERQKRRRDFRVKALSLLKDDTVQYDTNQALVLCQLKQFDEGIVYLYEKKDMYADILQFWMDKEETDRVIEGVRKYG